MGRGFPTLYHLNQAPNPSIYFLCGLFPRKDSLQSVLPACPCPSAIRA